MSYLSKGQNKGPRWYDNECRIKRSQAVKAGERIITAAERDEMLEKCREYRACKQRKKRAYKNDCIAEIEKSFVHNRCDMWHTLNSICNLQRPSHQPEAHEFYEQFLKTSETKDDSFFSKQFESEVKAFLDQYDNGEVGSQNQTPFEMDILNSNFTVQEVEAAIDYLKNNKSPGCDNILAEFIKYYKEILLEDLTTIYNYIIESRDFPDKWVEGLRSVIFRAGQRNLVKNYRGITVLFIFAKLFEILVHSRMTFLNEAFCKID